MSVLILGAVALAGGPARADLPEVNFDLGADNQAHERRPPGQSTTGTYRFVRTGDTNSALTILYSVGGTAANGVDYELLPGSVELPAGATSVDLLLVPIADGVAESAEPATLTILDSPGLYTVGLVSNATVTIQDAIATASTWRNSTGNRNWERVSTNWANSVDKRFVNGDSARFGNFDSLSMGRIYVGTGTWMAVAGVFSNPTPVDVLASTVTVVNGEHEFEGGVIVAGMVDLQGGRVTDRELGRTAFGSSVINLRGGAEFCRQITGNTNARNQAFDTGFLVAGPSGGAVHGGPGTNAWRGAVELQARFAIGLTNASPASVNRFSGTITINRDAVTGTAARVVALRAGGGQAYLDGPIVDDPDVNHSGNFPLWLETQTGSAALTLSGTNTYSTGTIVTNAGGTNGVVVVAGSSLGSGAVSAAGNGARLRVEGAGGVSGPLFVGSGATVSLMADQAFGGALVTVANGGLVDLRTSRCLPGEVVVSLSATGRVQIVTNVTVSVRELQVNGESKRRGLYTSVDLPGYILPGGALFVRGPRSPGAVIIVK